MSFILYSCCSFSSSLKKARFLDVIDFFFLFLVLYCKRCKVTSKSDPGSISKAMNVCCSVCIIEKKKKENLSQTCLISFCVNNDFKIYIYLYKYIYITRVCVHAECSVQPPFCFGFFFSRENYIFVDYSQVYKSRPLRSRSVTG